MIKVDDIAFVRFSAPDLDKMETFLTDFGLARAHRDAKTLYMRGLDGDPYLPRHAFGRAGLRRLCLRGEVGERSGSSSHKARTRRSRRSTGPAAAASCA